MSTPKHGEQGGFLGSRSVLCNGVFSQLAFRKIQTWLGHSNYNFTADIYVHSAVGVHEAMPNTLSERLEELLPQNFNSETDLLEER